jgi:hypothetical protein
MPMIKRGSIWPLPTGWRRLAGSEAGAPSHVGRCRSARVPTTTTRTKLGAHAVLRGRQQPGCLYMPAATLGAEWLLQLLAVAVGGEVVRCPFIETLVACAMVKPIVCFVNFYTGVAAFLAAQRRLPSFPAHRSSSPTVAGNSRIAMHGSVDLLRGVPLPQSEQLSPLSSIVPGGCAPRRKRETYWLADDFHRWRTMRCSTSICGRSVRGERIDALRYSLSANATHGKQRVSTDYAAYRTAYPIDTDAARDLLRCSGIQADGTGARRRTGSRAISKIADMKAEGKSTREIGKEVGLDHSPVVPAHQSR